MIYFVRCGKTEFIKIGTAKNVLKRIELLQSGSPFRLVLLAVCEGARCEEKRIHAKFKNERRDGEWFCISKPLRDFILELMPASEFYDGLDRPRLLVRLDASFIRPGGYHAQPQKQTYERACRCQALQGFDADHISALRAESLGQGWPAVHPQDQTKVRSLLWRSATTRRDRSFAGSITEPMKAGSRIATTQ